MPSHPGLDESVIDSEIVYRGRYLSLRLDTVERADGSRARREVVGHPGAVAIVALDADERVALVRQFRIAAGRTLFEIPAGTLDVDTDSGSVEDPDVAAARELEEETGLRAGTWTRLASFWTAPGFATELMHLYLATDLRPVDVDRRGPEEDERLELEWQPFREAVAAAARGELADAKSLLGLLLVDRMRGQPAAVPGTPTPPSDP